MIVVAMELTRPGQSLWRSTASSSTGAHGDFESNAFRLREIDVRGSFVQRSGKKRYRRLRLYRRPDDGLARGPNQASRRSSSECPLPIRGTARHTMAVLERVARLRGNSPDSSKRRRPRISRRFACRGESIRPGQGQTNLLLTEDMVQRGRNDFFLTGTSFTFGRE